MKIQHTYVLSAICLSGVLITSCNGLSKMIKNASQISYTVKPNPMQENGDSVAITISASYPARYFNKKAVVTVTPTLKFADGTTQALKSITLVGEKAAQSGQKIDYDKGGSVNYSDKVAYLPQMKNDELDINATIENNKKTLPPVKIAEGTIITAQLVQKDARPILGKDNFSKTTAEPDTTHIFYTISNATVRPKEMKSAEMKDFKEFVEKGIKDGYKFNNIDVSAYASPDGETQFNAHLAEDRAKSAIAAMKNMFKEMNTKKRDTKFGTEKEFYTVTKTGMDWDGFQVLVKKSNIKDKDLILRVLSMYSDHDQRMKEIKNMSKTYTELADDVLPKLRRSIIQLNAEKKSRSDEQLKQLVSSHADSLSVEEILYSATLTNDAGQKLAIYKTAERQYPNDWRGFNNSAYEEIMQNEPGAAKADLDNAARLSPSNAIVENNQGVVALMNNDFNTAMADFKKAGSAGPEVSYNMGIIEIKQGDYTGAVSSMGNTKSFNTSLAMLLNNDATNAKSTLDASGNRSGVSFYLKAVIAAREGNKSDVMSNLQSAVNEDASLKKMAANDYEFAKYRTDNDFRALVGSPQ